MRAPSAGVPLPGGRPAPSGRTLMSHAATSAGVSGFPRFGACANAAFELRQSVSTTRHSPILRVHMLHLSVAFDRPTRDGIVVFVRKSGHGRNARGFAASSDELGPGRLRIPRLVPRPALQYRRTAVPPPRHTESREGFA